MSYAFEDARAFLPPEVYASLTTTAFHLSRCSGCGFWLTSPQPDTAFLSQLYGKAEEGYYEPLAEASQDRVRVYEQALEILRRRGIERGRLLDVGCGTGAALRTMGASFEKAGVEPSRFAAERARQAAGADVHVGDLPSARYPAASFDAVTAFDVVEHLPDPPGTLAEIRRILKPGGVLIVETGDISSLNARLAGGHWYYVLLPGHISFFSPRTLARVLGDAGFRDVRCRRTHHGGVGPAALLGQAKALGRHLLIQAAGPRVLRLPLFRSQTVQYRIPYFYDHMLVAAQA